MIEVKLILLLIFCVTTAVFFFIYVTSENVKDTNSKIYIIIMVTNETVDIEWTVRDEVYPVVLNSKDAHVVLVDSGANEESLRIFDKMMDNIHDYQVIKLQNVL